MFRSYAPYYINRVHFDSSFDFGDPDLAHLGLRQSQGQRDAAFDGEVPELVLLHAQTVVDRDHYLVVPFRRLSSTQPDLVLTEVRCYELDYLLHVQTLS